MQPGQTLGIPAPEQTVLQRESLAMQEKAKRAQAWLWLDVNEEMRPEGREGPGCEKRVPGSWMNQLAWAEVKEHSLLVWEKLGVQGGHRWMGQGLRRGRIAGAVGRGVLAGEGWCAVTSEGPVHQTDGAFIFLLKSFKPS